MLLWDEDFWIIFCQTINCGKTFHCGGHVRHIVARSKFISMYLHKEHIWQMKHFGMDSTPHRMSGRSLVLAFHLFSLYLSCSPSFSPHPFPTDTCRQAHTSREPTSEKCNLSISAPQRKDKQCWKNKGINTRRVDAGQTCHVPSNSQMALPRSVLTGVEIQGQTWLRPCCCFWVCLLVVLVAPLLFGRAASPGSDRRRVH